MREQGAKEQESGRSSTWAGSLPPAGGMPTLSVLLVVLFFILVLVTGAVLGGCGRVSQGDSDRVPGASSVTGANTSATDQLLRSNSQVSPGAAHGAGSTVVATFPGPGTSGGSGLGDPYFPMAGNEGYDVTSYDIELTIEPTTGALSGATTIEVTAARQLESFNLDLQGLEVHGLTVDGVPVPYRRDGGELTVVCRAPLAEQQSFRMRVEYAGTPQPLRDEGLGLPLGWVHVGDTVYTLGEPQGAATWFPVNDHPSDKALYTFRLTVPWPYLAVANGILASVAEEATKESAPSARSLRTFLWRMDRPMPSYAAGVVVGRLQPVESPPVAGALRRDYYAEELADKAEPLFAQVDEALMFFTDLLGPYPFASYGVVVPAADVGGAMENQTLSLFGRDVVEKRMSELYTGDVYLSHELAHQWFGNSVTLKAWNDVWLNEGFATYASWLWAEHRWGEGFVEAMVAQSRELLKEAVPVPPGDPGPRQLFGTSVYRRGALTLHALRDLVGEDTFFFVLREWVRRYAYSNVTTADFIALVKEAVGAGEVAVTAKIDALFAAWLHGRELPRWPE